MVNLPIILLFLPHGYSAHLFPSNYILISRIPVLFLLTANPFKMTANMTNTAHNMVIMLIAFLIILTHYPNKNQYTA